MNTYKLRSKIAFAIIRLTCLYICDAPIRSIHLTNKRTVGEKLNFLMRETETGNTFKIRQSHIHDLHQKHLRAQTMLKRLYREETTDDK